MSVDKALFGNISSLTVKLNGTTVKTVMMSGTNTNDFMNLNSNNGCKQCIERQGRVC